MYQHPNSEAATKRRFDEAKRRLREMEELIGEEVSPQERAIDTTGDWRSGDATLEATSVELESDPEAK